MARVVCIPARDEADELVALMVGQMLERMGCQVVPMPATPGDGLSGAEEISAGSVHLRLLSLCYRKGAIAL